MGSIVTRPVPDFHLVIGNPARSVGCVCRCGEPLARWDEVPGHASLHVRCAKCGWEFSLHNQQVRERIENEVTVVGS
jgi:hypothetical protein